MQIQGTLRNLTLEKASPRFPPENPRKGKGECFTFGRGVEIQKLD